MVAASQFECNRMTILEYIGLEYIGLIWKRARESFAAGDVCANVNSLKKQCGRKRKDYSENLDRMREISFNRRSTLRSLSYAIGIPKTTLFRIYKRGDKIKRESSAVKPYLTDQNKLNRVQFSLSMILPNGYFQELSICVWTKKNRTDRAKVKGLSQRLCLWPL